MLYINFGNSDNPVKQLKINDKNLFFSTPPAPYTLFTPLDGAPPRKAASPHKI
jgi:hypothetical protein